MTAAACLFIAAAPPIGFAHYLDSHVLGSAETALHDYAHRMIGEVDEIIGDGAAALSGLYQAGVTACGPGAREEMRRAIFEAYLLREIAVTGRGNTVLCGDSIIETERWTLSRQTAANAGLDISVAITYDSFQRSLALRYRAPDETAIVAHFAPNSMALDILPEPWRRRGMITLSLLDGTEFETFPQLSAPEQRDLQAQEVIHSRVASERYPIQVDVVVEQAAVLEEYQQVKKYVLIAMTVFAAVVIVLAAVLVRRRRDAGDDIATALENGEFVPFYQPVINLTTGRLEGCEVLVRRRRPSGLIDVPASFIAHAEADGQIVPITRSLMRQVIGEIGEAYLARRDLTVAFNLCAQHFRDDSVVSDVEAIFRNSPILFEQLVFEITERFPLADMAKAKTIVARLQVLGAKIALDDAGTGHSGLAALHRLGMDIVKIDKLFIDPINADTTSAPIVDTLVELAQNLNMSVVAEGVETLEQVRYLKEKGVHTAQGYLFAPPLPASSFVTLVEAMVPLRQAGARAAYRA